MTGLGVTRGRVRLAEATSAWTALYEAEAERLRAALAASAAVVERCGSTSVPGLAAKPIIDMLVGVPAPLDVPALRAALMSLGYEHATWAGVPGHEVFGRGDPRAYLLHVVPVNGEAWRRMLAFRNALRAARGACARGRLRRAEALARRALPRGPRGVHGGQDRVRGRRAGQNISRLARPEPASGARCYPLILARIRLARCAGSGCVLNSPIPPPPPIAASLSIAAGHACCGYLFAAMKFSA